MSLCQIHWYSAVLKKQTTTTIILPDKGKPPFAAFYLLHGLSDDHAIWARRTRIEHYVRDLPLIVVMPDGYRGFYTNNAHGPAYATHMAEELPEFIQRSFPAGASRSARCVGGLSMGGYGALRLALGYPDRYVSATSHSGAVMLGQVKPKDDEYRRIFGAKSQNTDHDLRYLSEKARAAGKLPAIRMDCGTDDFLLEQNRAFHRQLAELNIKHEYEEFPGAHTWDYWDLHVQEAIAFHARHLKLKPA